MFIGRNVCVCACVYYLRFHRACFFGCRCRTCRWEGKSSRRFETHKKEAGASNKWNPAWNVITLTYANRHLQTHLTWTCSIFADSGQEWQQKDIVLEEQWQEIMDGHCSVICPDSFHPLLDKCHRKRVLTKPPFKPHLKKQTFIYLYFSYTSSCIIAFC